MVRQILDLSVLGLSNCWKPGDVKLHGDPFIEYEFRVCHSLAEVLSITEQKRKGFIGESNDLITMGNVRLERGSIMDFRLYSCATVAPEVPRLCLIRKE